MANQANQSVVAKLTKPAKGSGGDRYEAEVPGDDRGLTVYVPQTYSRDAKTGKPADQIRITFERM